VRSMASMVKANWHDGDEEQSDEIMEYYTDLCGCCQHIYNVLSTAEELPKDGYMRLNDCFLAIADSWNDMSAIPVCLYASY